MREGTSEAIFQFESGAVGYHGATRGARGTRLGYDFQVHTEKGLLDYDHIDGVIKLYDASVEHVPGLAEQRVSKEIWRRDGNLSKETQHEIKHFADCIINGKKPLTDAKSALEGLRIIWKMYEAEKSGTIADLRGLGLN